MAALVRGVDHNPTRAWSLNSSARNGTFIGNLVESGVDFVAVDVSQATRFTARIPAALAYLR